MSLEGAWWGVKTTIQTVCGTFDDRRVWCRSFELSKLSFQGFGQGEMKV